MPRFRTSPSSPPSEFSACSTIAMHCSSSAASAVIATALPPSFSASASVVAAASESMSAHATAAPSRAASTAIARPLPSGASASALGRVPAPTTSTRLSASRWRAGASPVASGLSIGQRDDARLALHAQRVQRVRHEVIVAHEHRHLDQLVLVITALELRPRLIGDPSVRVQLVGGAQQRGVERLPAGRLRARGDSRDLLVAQPRGGADPRVLSPLVVRAAVPPAPEDQELPIAGGQLTALQELAAERKPAFEQPRMAGERGEDVEHLPVRALQGLERAC